jgi:hypothetical protein
MTFREVLSKGVLYAGLAGVVSGCGAVDEIVYDNYHGDRDFVMCSEEDSAGACPGFSVSVCGADNEDYSHPCRSCPEVESYTVGICRRILEFEEKLSGEGFCYAVYEPVCGEDGVTYGNDCEARAEVLRFEIGGTCEGSVFEKKN